MRKIRGETALPVGNERPYKFDQSSYFQVLSEDSRVWPLDPFRESRSHTFWPLPKEAFLAGNDPPRHSQIQQDDARTLRWRSFKSFHEDEKNISVITLCISW